MESTGDAVAADTGAGAPEPCAFDLFVVHAAADADFVRGYLLPALGLPPARVLLIDALPLGGVLVDELERGVARSRFTVVVLSPAYLADRWAVFGEQLASRISGSEPRVIPLRLIDCELPLRLDARGALDFTDRARWEAEAARLRDRLHAPAPADEPIACPYPGMRPFDPDDASRFFGRAHEIEELIGRLDRGERELYVIGPSGSGKSSLVQAGLLPVLGAGSSRLGRTFVALTMRPGDRPTERLAKLLAGDPAAPAATLDAFLASRAPAERVLVFVNQLEELFTVTAAADRQRFIAILRGLRTEPRWFLLLGLRADFYGALMDSALWPEQTGLARLDVAPLRGTALATAIRAPAQAVGVQVEARLCDRLVADAADEPGTLPFVQETLRLLWDRRHRRLIPLAAYQELGNGERGLDVAIARRADTMMAALPPAQQAIARRVLLRLIGFGEGRADTRRQQDVRALRSAADDPAELARVLAHLVDHRLVTVDGDPTDHDALADLAHEALITGWPALRTWIEHRRADEQRRRRLEAKVADWIEHGRGAASLLDAVELSEAVQWMAGDAARELGYGPDLPALVAASRGALERQQRERRRRLRLAFAALAAFSLIVSILALVALQQRHEARAQGAVARQQTQLAQQRLRTAYLEQGRALLLDGHPMQALPYLVEARGQGLDDPVLRLLFGQAAQAVPLVTIVGGGSMRSAALSPDGTRIVTASADGTARVWDAATGAALTGPLEHHGSVTRAAFSRDGTRVVTASTDGTLRAWNAITGTPGSAPIEHLIFTEAAAFSADATRVVAAGEDQLTRVWDVATAQPVAPALQSGTDLTASAFSPDGTRVFTASRDTAARVWDAASGQHVTAPFPHHGWLVGAAFSPDGKRLVTASAAGTVQVWDAATGVPVTVPLQHGAGVNAAVFSPDGTRIVTASADGTARVWDATTGKPVTAPLPHRGAVTAAAFSPDGTRVVTGSDDKTAQLWNAATGERVGAPFDHAGGVNTVVFTRDGTRVLTASDDGTVRLWSAAVIAPCVALAHLAGVSVAAFDRAGTRVVTASADGTARVWDAAHGTPLTLPLEHRGPVAIAAFSADGTRVVTASTSSDDPAVRIWDSASGTQLIPPLQSQVAVTAASLSPDGARVVTASVEGTTLVWDATTGRPVTPLVGHDEMVKTATFSPDSTRVVTTSEDGTARVWSAATGAPLATPLILPGEVWGAVFSPDGTRVATSSADGSPNDLDGGRRIVAGSAVRVPATITRIWDAATGNPLTPALEGSADGPMFSPDGARLVTRRGDTAQIWDAATGKATSPPLRHQGTVYSCVFSPDGTRVVTASDDHTARVWDAATGKPITAPLEHADAVTAAMFSADGTRVVTASVDKTARVWDATTGKPVTPPLEHEGSVLDAAFSPDATRILTRCRSADERENSHAARLWRLPIAAGSLDDWRRLAACAPFALVDGVLVANPAPVIACGTGARP